jgi:hypothetical protein
MSGTEINPVALVVIAAAGYAVLRLVAPQMFGGGAADSGLRAEVDRLRAAQAEQAERLRALDEIVVRVIPEAEKTHLLNLRNGTATEYTGNRDVRESLRHLLQLGLVTDARPIDGINDHEVVNLHDFLHLTPRGEAWAAQLAIEMKH